MWGLACINTAAYSSCNIKKIITACLAKWKEKQKYGMMSSKESINKAGNGDIFIYGWSYTQLFIICIVDVFLTKQ